MKRKKRNLDANNQDVYRRIYSQGKELLNYPDEILVSYAFQTLKQDPDVHKILDVGCGAGRHVRFFSSLGYDAFGVDPSEEVLKVAHSRSEESGLDVSLEKGVCSSLPYDDEMFDVVLCWGVLNTIVEDSELESSMLEMLRVLRPGGRLLISLSSPEDEKYVDARFIAGNLFGVIYQEEEYYCRFWTSEEALKLCNSYGLSIEKSGFVLRCTNFDSSHPVAYHVIAAIKSENGS